jgi:hypothetical protein
MGSVTRTIRLDEEVDRAITEIAVRTRTNANLLRNKILRRYVELDYYAERFGVIMMFAASINKIMDKLDNEEIDELAQWTGQYVFKEYVMFSFKTITLRTVLKSIRLWGLMENFRYEESIKDGQYHIICQHGKSEKWCLYYKETLRAIFSDLLSVDVIIENTAHQILIVFPNPDMNINKKGTVSVGGRLNYYQ